MTVYTISMLLFGCNPLCIVNTFLVLLLSSCNSSLVQSRNAAEYLSKDISQLLIFYIILSTQFCFEKFSYSIFIFLANFLFRFLLLDLICLLFVCTYTHHFQSFNDFISFPSGCFIPSYFTNFPLFSTIVTHYIQHQIPFVYAG